MPEKGNLAAAGEVLQLEDAERLAILGCALAESGDDASHRDLLALQVLAVVELDHARVADILQDDAIRVERMGGEVDAHQLFLFVESLQVAPAFAGGNLRLGDRHKLVCPEERVGGVGLVGLELIAVAHQDVHEGFAFGVLGIDLLALQP